MKNTKTKGFASGPTWCVSQRKKTFNDGTGIEIKPLKNGSFLALSVCKECGKKKSIIISKNTFNMMKKTSDDM